MASFIRPARYTKGIYEANFYSTANRDLIYHDEKLTDANFASSVNMGEILAGLGNSPQIMLFDTARFNITLTAADVELRAFQLQTGGAISYNGITQTCEIVTPESTSIVLSSVPAVPYGYTAPVAYVGGDGTAYEVDVETKTVQGFNAVAGQQYSVRYYISKPATEVLDIKTLFAPEIVTAEVKYPVYQASTGSSGMQGTLCGYLWAICPRFQFNGEASLNANQTTNATSSLSGQALAYSSEQAGDCASIGLSSLLYLVWEPVSATAGVKDLVVLEGGQIEVAVNASATIPVKYIMESGGLANPDLASLEWVSAATGTASVANGVVTGVLEGDTEITITDPETNLVAVCNVSVTA